MQLSYDYAKDRALMCLRANYESHLWKDLLKLLKGRDPLCPVVDLGWYRDALPDDLRDLVDGARYRGLAHSEDLGHHALGGIRPVV